MSEQLDWRIIKPRSIIFFGRRYLHFTWSTFSPSISQSGCFLNISTFRSSILPSYKHIALSHFMQKNFAFIPTHATHKPYPIISPMCCKFMNFSYIFIFYQYSLHWPAFFKLFQIPRRWAQHSGTFFHADYEYLNHFFPARPDLPKFYVKSLKITLNGCF